jgi:uncharacterized protein (TIGR00730 family)
MSDTPAICVFCGSSSGTSPAYAEAARLVGKALVRHELGLVYGGGRVGLLGILADAVLGAGGRVIGVIPESLATREVAHDGLTELHVVSGMHERKALMATLSSAFLTLPGGIGTFEEFFEILSWGALGIHQKPIGILNVAGYFDPLIALLDHGIDQKFIRRTFLHSLFISDQPDPLIRDLLAYVPPPTSPRLITFEET